jgi:hypothetical protein
MRVIFYRAVRKVIENCLHKIGPRLRETRARNRRLFGSFVFVPQNFFCSRLRFTNPFSSLCQSGFGPKLFLSLIKTGPEREKKISCQHGECSQSEIIFLHLESLAEEVSLRGFVLKLNISYERIS